MLTDKERATINEAARLIERELAEGAKRGGAVGGRIAEVRVPLFGSFYLRPTRVAALDPTVVEKPYLEPQVDCVQLKVYFRPYEQLKERTRQRRLACPTPSCYHREGKDHAGPHRTRSGLGW